MKSASRIVPLMIFFIMAAGIAVFFAFNTRPTIWESILFPGKNTYSLQNEYEKSNSAYRALYTNGKTQLRIEAYRNVSAKQARDYNQYKTMQIEGLYETARSPYPGMLSDQITCDDAYKPVFEKTSTSQTSFFHGLLNDRLQYGSCIDSQVAYKTTGIMMYCSNVKTWYFLEFIVPKVGQMPIASAGEVKCR